MGEFQWPWEYTFPPFFTLQPNEATRRQQLNVWSELFLKYLKHQNKFTVNVNETSFPLFFNEAINRRLSPDFVLRVLEELERTAHAAPQDKRRTEWHVYWHTLDEYGNLIYSWVQETGQLNSVCTLYELASGDGTGQTAFHGIDETVLLNALRLLEQKGKCELINLDGTHGVKFF